MKKCFSILSLLFLLLVGLNSCGIVNYVGIDPKPTPVKGTFVCTVEQKSRPEVYIFGLGGAGKHTSAIRDLISAADLKEGEDLVNISCVSHTRFYPFTWLPLVVTRRYYVTADKVTTNTNIENTSK